MGLVGFSRLNCRTCEKFRWHECMSGLGRCVICGYTRNSEGEKLEITRFID